MKKYAFLIFFFIILLTIFLPAIAGQQQIHIVWFQWDPCFSLRDEWAPTYPDAEVIVDCVPVGDWHDAVFNDFALGEDGRYDLVILDSQWIGEAVVGDYLLELTSFIDENIDISDYYDQPFKSYSEYPPNSERYYGLPFESDVQLMMFRSDVFQDFGLDDVDSLSDLAGIAKTIHESDKWPGMSGYSTIYCSSDACYDQIASVFNQIAWSWGGEIWDSETFKIDGILQSDTNVEALEAMIEMSKYGPTEDPTICDFDCVIDAICNGKTAIATIWAGFGPIFTDPIACPSSVNLTFTVFPGEATHTLSLGGMGMHVNAGISQQRQQLALGFLQWQETQEQQRQWTRFNGFTSRKSVFATGLFLNSAEYAPVFAVSYPLTKDFWNVPEYSLMLPIQQEYLGIALRGELTPFEALDYIAKAQQRVLDTAYPDGPPTPPLDLIVIDDAVQIVFLVLAGVLILICIGLMIFVWMKKEVPIFRYSSPFFMMFILLGIIILISSLFSFAEDPPTEASCNIFLWFSVIGVSLVFSTLMAKTFRVFLLWRDASRFKSRTITKAEVVKAILLITAPMILVLIVWTAVDTNTPTEDIDALDDDEYIIKCDNDNLEIYLAIIFSYFGLFLVASLILAWLTRNLASAFNESTHISMILGNSLLISVIVIPLIFFISEDPTVVFMLESIALLFFSVLVIVLLFGTKIYKYYSGEGSKSPTGFGGSSTTSGTTTGSYSRSATTNESVLTD